MKRFLLSIVALAFLTYSAEAANRYLTCNTACTITAADTSIWGTSSGGTGASVPGSSDAVILDAATCVGGTTCTATVGSGYNPAWQSITMGACTASTTGCVLDFSVNNNNVTLSSSTGMSVSGTGTRQLKCGSGTFTLSGSGTVWDAGTTTNLTMTCGSAALSFTSTGSRTFNTGAQTYGTVTAAAAASAGTTFTINNAGATFNALAISAPLEIVIASSAATSLTLSTAPTWNGIAATPFFIHGAGGVNKGVINVPASSVLSWIAFQNITFSGNAATATNSFDLGGNNMNGGSINPPGSGGRIIGG